MICPRCNTNLQISNTQGIEIDFCPNCRGVWLDKGELEKIIERSNSYSSSYMGGDEHDHHNDRHYEKTHHDEHYGYGQHSRHKKGFLSELFDF
jgi:Zn-finger nucleic acid-binding protein